METKTKIALGLGAVAALMLFMNRSSIMNGIVILGQNYGPGANGKKVRMPWALKALGNGDNTFAAAACVFMSILMAFNAFNPDTPLDPLTANDLLKKANAFLPGSSAMNSQRGANALGMSMPDNERIIDSGGPLTAVKLNSMRNIIDNCLARGGLVLFRVDHDRDLNLVGDHSTLIYGRSGDTYLCADPALAETIKINRSNLQGPAGATWGTHIPYQGVAVSAMYNV